MKKTERYNLSQWELSDRVLMADFNRDNLLLDAALQGLAADIAAGDRAQSAALDAALQELGSQDAALEAALADARQELSATGEALGSRITSLDTKQTSALNSAKNSLSSTISSTKNGLETKISSLDTKAANALNSARAALEAEDARIDGAKLQLYTYTIPYKTTDASRCLVQFPAGLNLKDAAVFYIHVKTDSAYVHITPGSTAGTGTGTILNGTTLNGPLYANSIPASAVGFPMGHGNQPILLFGLSAGHILFGTSTCTWDQFTCCTVTPTNVNNSLALKGEVRIACLK